MVKQRNSNDALFRLIKSMNSGEKRFFNMLCSRQASTNGKVYLRLFYSIKKQSKNDESELQKQFKKEGQQFLPAKKYLHKMVLDALVQHHRKNSERSLNGTMLELEVLFEKGLYEEYELLLFKLRKTAEEKNDFLIVLDTLKKEKQLRAIQFNYYDSLQLKEIRKQEDHFYHLYKEIEDYDELENEVFKYTGKGWKIDSDEFRKISNLSLFKDKNKPRSLMAKWMLIGLRSVYYTLAGNSKIAFRELLERVQLLESNLAFQKSNPALTTTTYRNFIGGCLNLKEYDKGLNAIEKYKKFVVQYPELMKRKIINIYGDECILYRKTDRKEEAIKLINDVTKKISENEITPTEGSKFLFYLNASFVLLYFGENKHSLQLVNLMLNDANPKTNFMYYYNARILELINIFELRDAELLGYKIQSFRHLMLKQGELGPIDTLFINFFRKILTGKYFEDEKNISHDLHQLKVSIEKVLKSSSENVILPAYDDLSPWLEKALLKSAAMLKKKK